MAYKEDGKDLENYAGFMGDGFEPMPALYHDTNRLHHISEWPQEMLDERLTEYGQFLQKENLMPRAEATANRTMNHLLFEAAFRDGIYDNDLRKVEDETCTN